MGPTFRTCIGCNHKESKDRLLRLVRDIEGTIQVDPEGRQPGRGAYVHKRAACLEAGLTDRRLARAFRGRVTMGTGLFEAARDAARVSSANGQQDG